MSKIKTKLKKKDLLLTKEDFKKGLTNGTIDTLDRMLHTPLYTFRVKEALYSKKLISPKGFLFNDNIYSLPLGKKNSKGEILIDDDILKLLDRFMLGEEFADKGDALTAFMIDYDDILYDVFLNQVEDITKDEYTYEFSKAYSRVTDLLLSYQVSDRINDDPELNTELTKWNVKHENKDKK